MSAPSPLATTTTTETPVLEWRFTCPPDLCAYASEVVAGIPGVDAVQACYRDDEFGTEYPFELALYSRDPAVAEAVQSQLALDDLLSAHVAGGFRQATITEADWANAWKQFWHTTRMTPRLTVRPSWEPYTPTDPAERVIVLDPGSAFGTGAHDTTALMLAALDSEAPAAPGERRTLLDVGTGSGILAIAGAMLGWHTVVALDNDAHAVEVARANAEANEVGDRITFYAGVLEDLPLTEPVDCIVANILGPVLMDLAPQFAQRLKPGGGVLWCSGLIEASTRLLAEELPKHGFTNITTTQQNHWFALRATLCS